MTRRKNLHVDRAEVVVAYPDAASPDGRGVMVIKGKPSVVKMVAGRVLVLWLECEAKVDGNNL
jgi:hypothetical protein